MHFIIVYSCFLFSFHPRREVEYKQAEMGTAVRVRMDALPGRGVLFDLERSQHSHSHFTQLECRSCREQNASSPRCSQLHEQHSVGFMNWQYLLHQLGRALISEGGQKSGLVEEFLWLRGVKTVFGLD